MTAPTTQQQGGEARHHGVLDNLQPIPDERPPFWWDDTLPPWWKVPGSTEHELYEARPIPPYPFDKLDDVDVTPFKGLWMAWLPRCAPQLINLSTDKYNPNSAGDPRRKLDYVGQYNLRNPLPMEYHHALPDHGWWYATPRGVYVYHPYSAAWDLSVLQFKAGQPEVLGHAGHMFGRPTAIHRRPKDGTEIPKAVLTLTPAAPSVEVGKTVRVAVTGTINGKPFDPTPYVSWSIDKTDIATVDSKGIVTGVAAGSATLTAALDTDNTKTATVTVTAPPA